MQRKTSFSFSAILAFSLCTTSIVPVFGADADFSAPYEKGTLTETSYESQWLNLQFTPPDEAVMDTEAALRSVMKQGQNTLENASGVSLSEEELSGVFYEMMASATSGFPNVSLIVEEASADMNIETYFENVQQMLDLSQYGYTYEELTDIQIAGQDFSAMEAQVLVHDYEIIQKYCTRKYGEKFVSIILSYTPETTSEADDFLAAFTPLNSDKEAASAE